MAQASAIGIAAAERTGWQTSGEASAVDANGRTVVLFGRNVASYKFALAKTLLDIAEHFYCIEPPSVRFS